MKTSANIFLQIFVKPFYKENAGALVFVYTMMFFIVSTMDGAGMFAYHYSLVTSMLTLPVVFGIVFFLWFLYARKCAVSVSNIIRSPEHLFLYIINSIDGKKRFLLFLFIDVLLLLPILSYAVFIVYAGFHQQLYLPVLIVILYLLSLCVFIAARHVSLLNHPSTITGFSLQKIKNHFLPVSSYPILLLSFITNEQKAIWIGIKIYACGVLYLIARYNTTADYDTLMAFLFFNFGIHANGVLVYLIRQWEETHLSFYRSLPVPLIKRFGNYVLLYFILLLPEFITVILLVPVHLHYNDAISFFLCAYGLVLLMNSLLFLTDFSTKELVIVLLGVFCVQYVLLPTGGYIAMYLSFFTAAIALFFYSYYRFEKNAEKEVA